MASQSFSWLPRCLLRCCLHCPTEVCPANPPAAGRQDRWRGRLAAEKPAPQTAAGRGTHVETAAIGHPAGCRRLLKGRSVPPTIPWLPIESRRSSSASTNSIPMPPARLLTEAHGGLLVTTSLSAQSTDVNVNRVTPELLHKYPTFEAFAALTPEQLEPDVRSTGWGGEFPNRWSAPRKKSLQNGGQVPDDIDELLTLPGSARKTAT